MAATMRRHVGSPMAAALVNFAVGTVFLLGRRRCSGAARCRPTRQRRGGALVGLVRGHPRRFLHHRLGGLRADARRRDFPRLIVAGQMVAALALDHYGWLGFPVRPLDAWRIGGALLVVCGMFLLARGSEELKGTRTFTGLTRSRARLLYEGARSLLSAPAAAAG